MQAPFDAHAQSTGQEVWYCFSKHMWAFWWQSKSVCGALSQQVWDRKVTASLSGSCDVNVGTVLRFRMCFLQQQHSYLIPPFLFILFLHR